MPKYTEPKDAVGLMLRAVIEGEAMNSGLGHKHAEAIATLIEARIQAGPSDWLSLSDGTTFSKTFTPAHYCPGCQSPNCPSCNSKPDPVQRAADSIHAAHEERVKTNSWKVSRQRIDRIIQKITLGEDIAEHEQWLHSFGSKRIFVQ